MTTRKLSLLACLIAVTIAVGARGAAAQQRCSEGSWTVDGGPVTVGPLDISLIGLRDDGVFLTNYCRVQRWGLDRVAGETRLRALFLCQTADQTQRPHRFALRLRARIAEGCAHMQGMLAMRRFGAFVRFTATRTGSPCASDAGCTAEAFCQRPPGECTAAGTCEAKFPECLGLYAIVCGCDGQTYDYCTASAAGVSTAYLGPCSASCGGITGVACPDGEFCELPPEQCGAADLGGHCVQVDGACPEFYSPVCGCDGITYANDCFRQAAGAQKAHDGACGGCTSLLDCLPNEFCQAPDGQCEGPGACTFIEQVCPGEYDPVCGCDGETYANRCRAAMRAVSIAHAGRCDGVCGGIAGIPCADGEFCELPPEQCGAADLEGHCIQVDGACPEFYSPVCGCDGVTYANDCFRQMARAQKAADGPCECVPGSATCETTCDCYRQLGTAFCDDCPLLCPNCGDFWQCKAGTCVEQCGFIPPDVQACVEPACATNAECPDDAYCAKPLGECATAGLCQARPLGCPDIALPVCGCDGKTYGNRCDAAAAGASVAHEGECQEVCGGFAGIPCAPGDICELPPGLCEWADLQGRCVPKAFCTQQYDPVCGCDGQTYPNDCERLNAGVQLAHPGKCQ